MSELVDRATHAISTGAVTTELVQELVAKVQSLQFIVDGVDRWMGENGPRVGELRSTLHRT